MANKKPELANLKRKGKGRPRGSKNKFTTIKIAFERAFNEIGGEKALAEWAKKEKNRADFYRMLTKMLPKNIDIKAEVDRPHPIVIMPQKMTEEVVEDKTPEIEDETQM